MGDLGIHTEQKFNDLFGKIADHTHEICFVHNESIIDICILNRISISCCAISRGSHHYMPCTSICDGDQNF